MHRSFRKNYNPFDLLMSHRFLPKNNQKPIDDMMSMRLPIDLEMIVVTMFLSLQ